MGPDVTPAAESFARGAGINLFVTSRGAGPTVVLLHGFPDDHRTWDAIAARLAPRFRLVTPDLRGYGRSDKPIGVEHYRMDRLVGDVIGLLDALGERDVILVGHDWGAVVAQMTALHHRSRVRRLVMLNIPHLNGLRRELARNREQEAASWYARLFQDGLIEPPLDWRTLWRQLRGGSPQGIALSVLRRSYLPGLLDYYRANYPRPPYRFTDPGAAANIKVPTLIIFGVEDPFVLPACLDDNEKWFDAPPEIIRVQRAGHWVHHDAPDQVADAILTFATSATTTP
jgi:pimeloyl-ACP methyl ester carboxylesterase